MFLEADEIKRLTGKCHLKKQMEVLDAKGITYFVNGINELVVSRRHVEAKLGALSAEPTGKKPNFQIFERAS